jgi:hypothetical protein
MRVTSLKTWLVVLGCALLSAPAYALSLTSPGVVGAIDTGTQSSNPTNEAAWASYLLFLGANADVTTDAPGSAPAPVCATCPNDSSSDTERYRTSSTDYAFEVLSGGVQTQTSGGANIDLSGSTAKYVLAKYDGQNAGYVLFAVAGLAGGSLPGLSDSLWTNIQGNGYAISHYTLFGNGTNVPDGGTTLTLLGLALAGLGAIRRAQR